jgi:hypothetical protein
VHSIIAAANCGRSVIPLIWSIRSAVKFVDNKNSYGSATWLHQGRLLVRPRKEHQEKLDSNYLADATLIQKFGDVPDDLSAL